MAAKSHKSIGLQHASGQIVSRRFQITFPTPEQKGSPVVTQPTKKKKKKKKKKKRYGGGQTACTGKKALGKVLLEVKRELHHSKEDGHVEALLRVNQNAVKVVPRRLAEPQRHPLRNLPLGGEHRGVLVVKEPAKTEEGGGRGWGSTQWNGGRGRARS